MDVRLSPEQQELRAAAARAVDRLGVHTVADLDDAERADKLDAAVRAAGWRELRSESDGGGPWASGVEVAIVAEELGRGLADTPFAGPTLAADLRRHAGAPVAPDAETIVLDRTLGALALVADGAVVADAVAFEAGGCASGVLVTTGGELVAVALGGDHVEVDLTRPSIRIVCGTVTARSAGWSHPTGLEAASDARCRWTALGLALTCADLVGVMRGAVALTASYASERRQYGVPVGSFQAVQHLLADALVATEGSSSVTRHVGLGGRRVDALGGTCRRRGRAKAYCARAARTVCETAIQVHGGIGNTWECLAHVYLRRALLSIDVLGGVGPSLTRVLAHRGIGDERGLR